MAGLMELRDRITLALGMREPTVLERIQQLDPRAYIPQRMPEVDWRAYAPSQRETTGGSTGIWIAAGVIAGFGIAAYMMRDRIQPAVEKAREQLEPTVTQVKERAAEAATQLNEQLPERLRITRLEEQKTAEKTQK